MRRGSYLGKKGRYVSAPSGHPGEWDFIPDVRRVMFRVDKNIKAPANVNDVIAIFVEEPVAGSTDPDSMAAYSPSGVEGIWESDLSGMRAATRTERERLLRNMAYFNVLSEIPFETVPRPSREDRAARVRLIKEVFGD